MPQSLSAIFIHLVFSTRYREPLIRAPVQSELYAYGATVLQNLGCPVLAMNGMPDHVHVLFNLSRVMSLAEVVENLKTSTSRWIKTKGNNWRTFHWQNGYSAFSVSQPSVQDVIEYIQRQKEHHQGRTFQDELQAMLRKYEVSYDERYLWD